MTESIDLFIRISTFLKLTPTERQRWFASRPWWLSDERWSVSESPMVRRSNRRKVDGDAACMVGRDYPENKIKILENDTVPARANQRICSVWAQSLHVLNQSDDGRILLELWFVGDDFCRRRCLWIWYKSISEEQMNQINLTLCKQLDHVTSTTFTETSAIEASKRDFREDFMIIQKLTEIRWSDQNCLSHYSPA